MDHKENKALFFLISFFVYRYFSVHSIPEPFRIFGDFPHDVETHICLVCDAHSITAFSDGR